MAARWAAAELPLDVVPLLDALPELEELEELAEPLPDELAPPEELVPLPALALPTVNVATPLLQYRSAAKPAVKIPSFTL